MNDDITINGTVLEDDAEKVWQAGSDALLAMRQDLPYLVGGVFSTIPGSRAAAKHYDTARTRLQDYLKDGSDEFLKFEHLLLKTVLIYLEQHDASMDDIARIQKELES